MQVLRGRTHGGPRWLSRAAAIILLNDGIGRTGLNRENVGGDQTVGTLHNSLYFLFPQLRWKKVFKFRFCLTPQILSHCLYFRD